MARPGWNVVIRQLTNPSEFVGPFGGEHYVSVIWGCDDTFDPERRHELATVLIHSGCRYVVCGGVGCEQWHDAADLAWVTIDLDNPSGDTPFVMTSWHTDDSEEDVIHFALNCTNFDEHDFTKLLVLLAGKEPTCRHKIEAVIHCATQSN